MTTETPYTGNPQAQEIARLESEVRYLKEKVEIERGAKETRDQALKDLRAQRVGQWPVNAVKAVLRVLTLLLWFVLTLGLLVTPWIAYFGHRKPAEIFWLVPMGMILFAGLWVYIHEKD